MNKKTFESMSKALKYIELSLEGEFGLSSNQYSSFKSTCADYIKTFNRECKKMDKSTDVCIALRPHGTDIVFPQLHFTVKRAMEWKDVNCFYYINRVKGSVLVSVERTEHL